MAVSCLVAENLNDRTTVRLGLSCCKKMIHKYYTASDTADEQTDRQTDGQIEYSAFPRYEGC